MKKAIQILFYCLLSLMAVSQEYSKQQLDSMLNVAENGNDSMKIVVFDKIGYYYVNKDNRLARQYLRQSLELLKHGDLPAERANALNALANVYNGEGNYSEALKYFYEALEISETQGDFEAMTSICNGIGNAYLGDENLEMAKDFYDKSYSYAQEINNKPRMAVALVGITNILSAEKKYEECLEKQKESATLFYEMGKFINHTILIANMIDAYKGLGDTASMQLMIDSASSLALKYGDPYTRGLLSSNIGSNYAEQHKWELAELYYKRALIQLKKIDAVNDQKYVQMQLAELYRDWGQADKAFEALMTYVELNDSVFNENRSEMIEEMNAKYKTAEKEKQLVLQEAKLSRNKILLYGVSGGAILMLLLMFFIYKGYDQKKQANIELASKNLIIEAKNKDITDSISYAKRLQDAILPSVEQLMAGFQEAFIFYKPKDIVSGDFYWCTQIDDKIVVAVADCTGHGVPGAMMSMMGHNLLNQIVHDNNITSPSDVLTSLHAKVKTALQKSDKHSAYDGMDIALTVFNKQSQQLTFAGAFRSLVMIRNGKLTEYKGNKRGIGMETGMQMEPFTNQVIAYEDGDLFYMYSDGYSDQFGGVNGKKFMTRKFKELLQELAPKELGEQQLVIKSTFDNWKGEYAQVDDICVMGLKV